MHVKTLIIETLELQGFRIGSVTKYPVGIFVQIEPDRRFKPRCGR